MSNAAERSEIAVLQTQMKGVQNDISEMKGDMKEIKTLLLSSSTNGVTKEEFEKFKAEMSKASNFKSVGWALIGAIFAAMAYALIVGRTH